MPKYLTEQVDNGTPYADILEVHNRLIAAGKAIRFFYKFIKDYTVQLANHYSITLDWTGIPDEVDFNHDWLQEGDVVGYLNDLVEELNYSKDMLAVANGQFTTFFKKFLDVVDTDNDSLSSLVVGDVDNHAPPDIDYEKLFFSWNVGDVIYADDFNQIKDSAYNLLKAMQRIFGAYYDLIDKEGLDLKADEFINYGIEITDSSLTFSNLISDWTKVEPYAPESGATVFYQYDDDYKWNHKVVIWKSQDETAHRFTIWNYFTQEYVYDSGWYPAQSYPTSVPKHSEFEYWYSGYPQVGTHIFINPDYTKIGYTRLEWGKASSSDYPDDEAVFLSFRTNVVDLDTFETSTNEGMYFDDKPSIYMRTGSEWNFKSRHLFSQSVRYEKVYEDGWHSASFVVFSYSAESTGFSTSTINLASDEGDAEIDVTDFTTGLVSHLGTGSVVLYAEEHEEDDDGDDDFDGFYEIIYVNGETSITMTKGAYGYDSGGLYQTARVIRKFPSVVLGSVEESASDDWSMYVGSSIGRSGLSNSCGSGSDTILQPYHKFKYGIAYSYGEGTCLSSAYYWGYVFRLDRPVYEYKGYTRNNDGEHPVEWTPTNFDRTDEYVGIYWEYPEIKWLIPYKQYYNIQNPRVFEDTTTVDSTGVAYFVTGKYFVPETWYGYPTFNTLDGFLREDGTLPIRFHYWGTDADKLNTYQTLIIKVL